MYFLINRGISLITPLPMGEELGVGLISLSHSTPLPMGEGLREGLEAVISFIPYSSSEALSTKSTTLPANGKGTTKSGGAYNQTYI